MTRTYSRDRHSIECRIFENNSLKAIFTVVFPGGVACPHYHFNNYRLILPELNFEIARFIKFVSRVMSGYSDLEKVDASLNYANTLVSFDSLDIRE